MDYSEFGKIESGKLPPPILIKGFKCKFFSHPNIEVDFTEVNMGILSFAGDWYFFNKIDGDFCVFTNKRCQDFLFPFEYLGWMLANFLNKTRKPI